MKVDVEEAGRSLARLLRKMEKPMIQKTIRHQGEDIMVADLLPEEIAPPGEKQQVGLGTPVGVKIALVPTGLIRDDELRHQFNLRHWVWSGWKRKAIDPREYLGQLQGLYGIVVGSRTLYSGRLFGEEPAIRSQDRTHVVYLVAFNMRRKLLKVLGGDLTVFLPLSHSEGETFLDSSGE